MKKIALVTDGIWPYVLGGMQKHSYYLCKYFAKSKIHVDLYHFNQSELNINLLDVFNEEEKKYIHSVVLKFPNEAKGFGHYLKNSRSYSELVFDAIKSKLNQYDFIYTKGFSGWKLIEEKHAGRIKCCKIGVKFHGYEMFQRAPNFKLKLQQIFLLRRPVKEISRKADVIFSYGGKITDIIKSLGVQESKIIELPSGVESDQISDNIRNTDSVIRFVYLGRYERRKGIEEINTALQSLDNKLEYEFHFIGPIAEEKHLKISNCKYHGEIRDKNKLNTLLKNCDVLVCPSWSEGMPNVILEAMSNGLAILASDVGATNVLVDSSSGWLIEEVSSEVIAKKIKEILSMSKSEIDLKKRNALFKINSHFKWEILIENLLQKLKA